MIALCAINFRVLRGGTRRIRCRHRRVVRVVSAMVLSERDTGNGREKRRRNLNIIRANHILQLVFANIQIAIATIMRFSVSETNPSGTLLLPPTQAHLSSRLSM